MPLFLAFQTKKKNKMGVPTTYNKQLTKEMGNIPRHVLSLHSVLLSMDKNFTLPIVSQLKNRVTPTKTIYRQKLLKRSERLICLWKVFNQK